MIGINNKKSQVTIFIIIGVLIILAAGLTLYFYGNTWQVPTSLGFSKLPPEIGQQIESCAKDDGMAGVYLLGSQGGYIYSFDKSMNTEYNPVAYHLYDGGDTSPSKEFMENQLASYLKSSFILCMTNRSIQGITYDNPQFDAQIFNDKIAVNLKNIGTFTKTGVRYSIPDIYFEYSIPLGNMLTVKQELIRSLQNNDFINLDAISNSDFEVLVFPYDKENIIYTLKDNLSDMNPFYFSFAAKTDGNSVPELEPVPDFVLSTGQPFSYQLNGSDPDNDTLQYESPNALVQVNQSSGLLRFTPPVAGDYEVEVCVFDKYLARDCKNMKFMIKNEK